MYCICCATYPVESSFVLYGSQVRVAVGAAPIMASEQSGFAGVFMMGPKTLAYRRVPANGEPSGLVAGVLGLPSESTTAIVGVAPVETVCAAELPLFHEALPAPPSK